MAPFFVSNTVSYNLFMKKNTVHLIVLLLSICSLAQAQSEENKLKLYRLDVSAGLYTSKDIYSSINFNTSDTWGKNSTATYFLSTSFYKKKKTEVGLAFGYQKPNLENRTIIGNNGATGTLDVQYYTIMPQVRFNWVTSEDNLFEMYSIFGFALTFVDESYTNEVDTDGFYPVPGAHVTGLGLRFGDKFGGFVEIGFGTKGMMSGGLSYRL